MSDGKVVVSLCLLCGKMESELVQLLQKPNALEDGSLQKVVQGVMSSRVLSDMNRVVDLSLFLFFFFFFVWRCLCCSVTLYVCVCEYIYVCRERVCVRESLNVLVCEKKGSNASLYASLGEEEFKCILCLCW